MEPSPGIHPEELQRVQRWFNSIGVKPRCPVCGGVDLTTLRPIAAPVWNDARTGVIPDTARPQLPVVCNKCAHTLLFDVDQMGMMPGRQLYNG